MSLSPPGPMASTRLLLVRHAHTDANELGRTPRMAGWTDIPLSVRGEAELELLRERFTAGAAARVVYASPLSRALRTAEAIARGRSIVPLRSLREISCGVVEGWLLADVRAMHPSLWERNVRQDDPDFRWPGGESYRQFRERVLRGIAAVAARHPGEEVLLVTHAGVVSQLVGTIRGASAAIWEAWRPGNSGVTIVDWEGCRGRLVAFDRREHLEERRRIARTR